MVLSYTARREEGLATLTAYNANPLDIDKVKITLQELFDLWKEKKAPSRGLLTG